MKSSFEGTKASRALAFGTDNDAKDENSLMKSGSLEIAGTGF
ncbi:MAG: hypothetical protein ACK5RO_09870 [Pseudobdellovibrionaceae bacterium]